jgi:hypothetical protein
VFPCIRTDLTDPRARSSLAEHHLTVIRAFLRHRVPGIELVDWFDADANAHRFALDPGRASARTLLVPRALLEDPALGSRLNEALVDALTQAAARPVTLTATGIRY